MTLELISGYRLSMLVALINAPPALGIVFGLILHQVYIHHRQQHVIMLAVLSFFACGQRAGSLVVHVACVLP